MPKVSVITINLNNRTGLEQTIQSVQEQSSSDKEFIIVDGASTDGSIDIINSNSTSVNKWVVEKDKGIYDAMNKGIRMATGDYLLFMNSGDRLFSKDVVKQFVEWERDSDFKVIYGDSQVYNKGQARLLEGPLLTDLNFWYRKTLNHQAVFFRKDVFESFGPYDLNYGICADFDILLRIFIKEPGSFRHFKMTVCKYDESGFSAAPENFERMMAEREVVLRKNLSEDQYRKIKDNYLNSLSLKERIRVYIYERPVLKKVFLAVFNLFNGKNRE